MNVQAIAELPVKLMHVDCSAGRETSNSRALAKYFVDLLRGRLDGLQVDYLDLALQAPPHVGTEPAMNAILADSAALYRRLREADALLFAMPICNGSMPTNVKAFIDAIVRAGVTCVSDEQGNPIRQKVLFLTTRGVEPGAADAHRDALSQALRAAFGVASAQFVDAQPLPFADPAARAAGLGRARWQLERIAAQWATHVFSHEEGLSA
ncbi:NAD(P)H-dependent oxidoreductase [Pseudomonas sp. UBA6310]|uniref:NAD(P)H-dependent oxidoreductase n=1 Tax=Pseudomonas sp. UBA6310 TaxID=1947327 RepID=UPI00257D250A|nr:NAD(P)H-dependent oxidoreductase [Pseudomonas sp. UBA6310]